MTQSQEDYLEAIYLIIQEDEVARVKDIADALNVSKPSVTNALRELSKKGYIDQEKYGNITLTPKGTLAASEIFKKHMVIKNFLIKILKVSESTAERMLVSLNIIFLKKH